MKTRTMLLAVALGSLALGTAAPARAQYYDRDEAWRRHEAREEAMREQARREHEWREHHRREHEARERQEYHARPPGY